MQVIYNARIHTFNPKQTYASALAIDGAVIHAVGTDDEIRATFTTKNSYNLHGSTLIPGLTDAHIHLEAYAFNQQRVDCETQTIKECLERVAARAKTSPSAAWILGHGWNQNNWKEGYGTAIQLDEVSPRNPVYMTHKSIHSAWVNSSALQQAGIDKSTPDPAGGRIGRMPNGDPNGILYETAMDLVESVIPGSSQEESVSALRIAQTSLLKMGLTGVHDFDSSRCFSALQSLHQANELKLRVIKGIPRENLSDAIALGLRTGFGDDKVRIGSVKLFADGALGPQTAAMLKPYEGDPQNFGFLLLDAVELFEIGKQAVSNGISMAVHAIGDRANHEVLNAYALLRGYEKSLNFQSQHHLRHRIEHVQVIHADDITRFSELNIIASMQPIHATSDMYMADRYWGLRSALAYAWRDQLNHGSTLIFGSDAPVESPNPFWGIYAALTRRRADGAPSPQGWYPEQRLNISEALSAYITSPAIATGMEDRLGRLAPGYLADLVVLKQDPFVCPPEWLLNIHPIATMVGGEWVYSEME